MPVIATGEVYAFPEGQLYLYASASGTVSGSGLAFVEDAALRLIYGWLNSRTLDGIYHDDLTGQRAELSVSHLYADRTTFALINASAAVHVKFEGLVTGGGLAKSALYWLYSGAVDEFGLQQVKNGMFVGSFSLHANIWSAFGQ